MIGRIIFMLICVGGLAGGLWLLGLGTQSVLRAWASESWPVAAGRILVSQVVRSTSHGRHGSSTSYKPLIRYSYNVDGQVYTGSEIAPGRNWGSQSSRLEIQAHPAGGPAMIHYLPSQPSVAVLEAGLHVANFGQLLFGLIFSTMATIFGLVALNAETNSAGRSMSLRRGAWGSRLVLPLIGLLVLEFVATIWLS